MRGGLFVHPFCTSFCVNMNFLFWNVCGLGKGEKNMSIQKLVGKYNIYFLGMVETKHRRPIKRRIKRLWGCDDFDWCESLASDTYGGGIVTIWDPAIFIVSH